MPTLKNNEFETVLACQKFQKLENIKINTENGPGASRERRKQCAFDFQHAFLCFLFCFHGAKHSPLSLDPWLTEGGKFKV